MESKIKILLIEDDLVDARNFQRVLSKCEINHDFTHLVDAKESFKLLTSEHFDLVFIDYHMPQVNGSELLRNLRQNEVYTPVVIITSYADAKVAVELIQAGASDYIPKSLINEAGLAQSIRNAIKVSSLEQRRKAAESQLKKVESRLATIISNTPIILFAVDNKGVFRLGIGKHWGSFSPKEDQIIGRNIEEVFDGYTDVLDSYKSSFKGEIQKVTTEINDIIFEITFTPVFDNSNNLREVLGLAFDVTDRVKSESMLIDAKQLAEKTSKIKQEFIANISHEIRTPLNAIIGFTNLLEESPLNQLQSDFVDSIKLSGENLLSLINDVLDFSKIEAGKLSFTNEVFELREVVNAVLKVLESKVIEKKIALKAHVDEQIPKYLIGDPHRLYQLLMNLIGNAIKFTSKGEVNVEVSSLFQSANSLALNFQIKDTGIGIPSEKIDTIFDSFTQVESNNIRQFSGTGLGLSIVKKIIELLGGDIQVESEVGKGSVFQMQLNFKLTNATSLEQKVFIEDQEIKDRLKNKRILLAEDNAMNQKLVIMNLRKFDVQIDLAEDGIQAIKAAQSNLYDLILMDVQMPNMDGIEATKVIRNKFTPPFKDVPILAMTAHAFKEEVDKCLEVGMNAHISKPIDKDVFFKTLLEVLHQDVAPKNDSKIIKKEVSNSGLVDLTYLRDMSGGNEAFVKEMVELFKVDSPDLIGKLRDYLEKKDWLMLSKIAHKYRSPAVMMGMKGVSKLAETLEYSDYTFKSSQEKAEEIIDQIEQQTNEALRFIETNF